MKVSGNVCGIQGRKVFIDLGKDGLIEFWAKTEQLAWLMYCKHAIIHIELKEPEPKGQPNEEDNQCTG